MPRRVRDDDRGYRVSVIDAFRSWGLYPSDVNVLDESAVRWRPLETVGIDILRQVIASLRFSGWTLRADRRTVFIQMQENGVTARKWLYENARLMDDGGESLGLFIFVVNAVCLALVAWLVPGLTISGFWAALFGAIVISLVSWLLNAIVSDERRQ